MEEDRRERIEVLHKIDIPGGDPRWPARVQVERRTANKGGVDKTYINVVVAIGERKLFIPRRIAEDVGEALLDICEVASEEYEKLLLENNTRPQPVGQAPRYNPNDFPGRAKAQTRRRVFTREG